MLIDTDPGVDDALAVLFAFASPELEVVGLTSIFGNVDTPLATANSLRLLDIAGADVPVAEGASKPILCEEIANTGFCAWQGRFRRGLSAALVKKGDR